MAKDTKQNMIILLLVLVLIVQLFLKPSVHIEDNHLGIQYEIKELTDKINLSSQKIECNTNHLEIEIVKKQQEIISLNHELTSQRIIYEEFSIPLTLGKYCGSEMIGEYMKDLEEKYN